MSWRDAPLYVRCHDLAQDVLKRVEDGPCAALRHRLAADVQELLCEVSLGLTFVDTRRLHQAAADRAVARLKVLVRLGRDVGALSERGARHVGDELVEIGRMIGGWRRRHAREPDAEGAGRPEQLRANGARESGPPQPGREAPSPAPGA